MALNNELRVTDGERNLNGGWGGLTAPSEWACRRRCLVRRTAKLTVTWAWSVVKEGGCREGLVMRKMDADGSANNGRGECRS